MEPLAVYLERRPGVLSREFSLYPDKVHIRARSPFSREWETHVPLRALEPDIGTVYWRSRWFLVGAAFFSGGTLMLCVELGLFGGLPARGGVGAAMILTGASLAFMIATLRMSKAFRFVNTSGLTVLDIIEAGPEKARCAEFASKISEAITAARAAHSIPNS